MRILLVEDEVSLAEAVKHILSKNKYVVDMFHDGELGLDYALSDVYDIIILDIMLPKRDGISVLKELRKNNIETPVLLLTAKGEVSDVVFGLDSGADDYLTKPFAKEELLARINVLTRRHGAISLENTLIYGDISLDISNLTLSCKGESLTITLKEKEVIELLINRQGMVTSKDFMIEKLWGFDSMAEDNHVEVYISFVRKKLKFLNSDVQIKTLRGLGYKLEQANVQ
ncbi:MAG: response regulator transcription factor [Lachnospirales bacterium]